MKRFPFLGRPTALRLLVMLVALVGLRYALNGTARWMAIRSGEAAVAADVGVGAAQVSLLKRQVVLNDVRVENPHRPAECLLQADRCELDFAVGPLFHKRAVIEDGRITGLRIAAAPNDTVAADPAANQSHEWIKGDDSSTRAWLTNVMASFQDESDYQFESVRRAEALSARWWKKRAELRRTATELNSQALDLRQSTLAAEENRLRNAEFFRSLPSEVAALQQKFDTVGNEIDGFARLVNSERQAILADLEREEQFFRERFRLDPVEAGSLSTYLLREPLGQAMDELVGWLRWARRVVPAESTPRRQGRGQDIVFAADRPAPNFLIQALRLEGTIGVGSQPIEVRGLLWDVTDVPARHDAPIRMRLTSGGSPTVELHATIDRTGGVARDELLVDCQGVSLPELHLGRPGELEIHLASSVGSLSISAAVVGEKLSGDIQLLQKQVSMTPNVQGESRDNPIAIPLQATLGNVNSVATRLSLDGTLDEPTCTLWSNLGPAVAEAMDQSLRKAGNAHTRIVLSEARRQVTERLASLERHLADDRLRLTAETHGALGKLETIAGRQSPGERISVERLGRRLPAQSLFR